MTIYKKHKCLICNEPKMHEFLDLGDMPLANKYPTDLLIAEEFHPFTVLFCSNCKNVQLGTIISREQMFEDYYYLSSVNKELVNHFNDLANTLKDAIFVVDIGSNDGILLRPLKELGVNAIGVDPSINVSKIANDAGLTTITGFFNREMSEHIKGYHDLADVIVASSVFTHLSNPGEFIEDAKNLLTRDGKLIIEVEYIGNILKNMQFERFYLDRIFYYSLTSLTHLFNNHSMVVTDVEHISPHGGSIRVTVQNSGKPLEAVTTLLDKERKELTTRKLEDFHSAVHKETVELIDLLTYFRNNNIKVAGYGAPARITPICNYGEIGQELIPFVVDDSPIKVGKYTPGTNIPIVSLDYLLESDTEVLIVFAYDYIDDIKKKTNNRYKYIMPIPLKEL
jgi:SAM-dependent methyltransferase